MATVNILLAAWDDPCDKVTLDKLKEYRSVWKGSQRNCSVYVLTNFNSTYEEDLYRLYTLRDIDYDPYIMIFDKPNAPDTTRYLQRWVNNKQIFRTIKTFEKYDHTRG